jgi:hypothetical protein
MRDRITKNATTAKIAITTTETMTEMMIINVLLLLDDSN